MAKHKSLGKKLRLAKAFNMNQGVPVWVVIKSIRSVPYRPKRRNWRRSKIKNV